MNDEFDKVKEAFASLDVPAGLNERTISRIESYAREHAETFAQDEELSVAEKPVVKVYRNASKNSKRKAMKVWALAACFVLAFAGVFGIQAYAEPTAYIDMEVNPSITLAVNRFDRVLSAEGLNDDGAALLSEVSVVGLTSSEAVDTLLLSDSLAGYLDDESLIDVRIACSNEDQAAQLERQVGACLAQTGRNGTCSAASMEERQAAYDAGMGVGRYEMAKALVEADSSITLEDCANMSMRDLRQRVAEATGDDSYLSGFQGAQGGQNGSGQGGQGGSGQGGNGQGFAKGKNGNAS